MYKRQVLHDVCMQNLPVVFAMDRAGIVGEDGQTHHGVFDLSYLRHIPNLTVMAPKDAPELVDMLSAAVKMNAPIALRYPRGAAQGVRSRRAREIPIGAMEIMRGGNDLAIIAVGTLVNQALEAAAELESSGIETRVANARFVKPIDEAALLAAASECGALVFVEENAAQGGFASAALECLASNNAWNVPIEVVALPDTFVSHGKASDLRAKYGLDKQGIIEAANRALARPSSRTEARGDAVVLRQSI